jgi:hypothetical protein
MASLEQLQADFMRHLLSGDEAVLAHVHDSEQAPAARRMAIYQHAYRARLVEALATDYEQLQRLLGEAEFTALCHAYLDQYPSHYSSLRWFGKDLAAFLGYAAEQGDHPWQAEMAQLEWTFGEAFDAADAELAGEQDAAQVAPEAWPMLCMDFHPSLRLLPLWWNTLARWRAAKQEETPPVPQRLPQAIHCLLWRQGLTTQFRTLEADEAAALAAALAGEDFSHICGALAAEMQEQEQVALCAAGFLKTWLNEGLITRLREA